MTLKKSQSSGPEADTLILGLVQRSILCDPRRPDGKAVLNAQVKHREIFRPFAPTILQEHALEWFEVPSGMEHSPFMLRVWRFRAGKEKKVPAVAHVDGSGRVQTITAQSHPQLHEIVSAFHDRTGVPILLNTSFNVAGEPIVETPEDALWCLLNTGVDYCVAGDHIVSKREGYESLLDLCPFVVAQKISLEMPMVGQQLGNTEGPYQATYSVFPTDPSTYDRKQTDQIDRGIWRMPCVRAQVSTRWGTACMSLPEVAFRLLQLVDGSRTGHELREHMPSSTVNKAKLYLAYLFRVSVIRFKDTESRS